MKDLLEYIVKNLVSKPDEVKISQHNLSDSVNLKLKVNPQDMGIVIGKGGQTIKSIRKLLIARSLAENKHLIVDLELVDQHT